MILSVPSSVRWKLNCYGYLGFNTMPDEKCIRQRPEGIGRDRLSGEYGDASKTGQQSTSGNLRYTHTCLERK